MDALSEKKISWLRKYGALEQEGERLQAEAARWRSVAERTTRVLDAVPGGSGAGSVVERAVDEIAELELALVRGLREKAARRREMERAIEKIEDPRLRTLLRLRYIEGLKWQAVAEEMYYSDMQTMRLHREAIRLLEVPAIEKGASEDEPAA